MPRNRCDESEADHEQAFARTEISDPGHGVYSGNNLRATKLVMLLRTELPSNILKCALDTAD